MVRLDEDIKILKKLTMELYKLSLIINNVKDTENNTVCNGSQFIKKN